MKARSSGKTLAVDIGNTNITLGVFQDSRLLCSARAVTGRRTVDEMEVVISALLAQRGVALSKIAVSVVASVVPDVTPALVSALRRHHRTVVDVNDPKARALVPVDYRPVASVGADRLANAVAAHQMYPKGRAKIVVDFGTATTFDCVSADGVYLGGAIHPGVEISAQSLFEKTAQLPRIDFTPERRAVGKDTQSSIRAGLFFGIVGAVRELIRQIEREIGPSYRIGAGGLAPLVCPAVGGFHAVDADLTLKGIKMWFDKFRASQVA
ncbi:MAG: hypothetical protein A3G34_11395 [Candidatus Lindowbacteria bacterium RIFCSPLOWO2_12_FULL_62_27]|nr:MAG: hypothetical protein A3I06_16335 [Candidatus Lindowbacteria bacterium RIFCSPLOWO2_02_FULL_62_12]OGH60716.1 MAG: hypothetical protein A3G34_11395 [Candidatus Lindowbacteria bacterium RIFCSPLOWO2_12_FULL_62_27]